MCSEEEPVMKNIKKIFKNIVITVGVVGVFFCLGLWVEEVFRTYSPIPAFFALAVFFISLATDGYVYGIIASLISVLALNFAFTFPYFKFNFSIPENMVAAVIMLIITIVSSTLTTRIRNIEKIKTETEKEKMRANLLRAVSHDLRSPLTTIFGSSSVIVDKYDELTDEQLIQLAKGIKEDSQWLIGMVENLLSITKIDSSNVKLNMKLTVLEELIDIVLVRFKKRYPEQKIVVEIPEDFIIIPMDAVLIEQVLSNLLENAVIHAKGMTQITFRVTTRDDQVIFEIIDDGCGIPKEKLSTIFSGYYDKKEVPADSKKRNMGIGLSVCASIIKAHDGKIEFENLKPKGCCFRFVLKMGEIENEQQI